MPLYLNKNIPSKLREVTLRMNLQLINKMALISSQFCIFLKISIIYQTTKQFNSLSYINNHSKTKYCLNKYNLRTSKDIYYNSSNITQLILRKFNCNNSNNNNKSLNWNHLRSRMSNKYFVQLKILNLKNNSTLIHNKNLLNKLNSLGCIILLPTPGILRIIYKTANRILI